MKDWKFNEFNQVGVDYTNTDNTSIYDSEMEQFRDYEKEVLKFVESLNVPDTTQLTVVDIGCGTGAFSIHAAKYFKKIYAVDVSEQMLSIATAKAKKKGIANIEFCHSGFLQFQPPEPVDVVFSKWAFHHLPDYWKQAGLLNIHAMLTEGGVFYLYDVVFTFDPNYEASMDTMLENMSKEMSAVMVAETKIHIRDEFSTFDWVLQGMIERAGFTIERSDTEDLFKCEFFCRKDAV